MEQTRQDCRALLVTVQRVRGAECDDVTQDMYRATRAFFAAGEVGSGTDRGASDGGGSAQSSTGAEGHWAAPPTEGGHFLVALAL